MSNAEIFEVLGVAIAVLIAVLFCLDLLGRFFWGDDWQAGP